MESMCIIITNDEKQYKLDLKLLRKYSGFFSIMMEDEDQVQNMDPLKLDYISSGGFDYIYEFFQLHKVNAPKQVSKPVMRKVKLATVMSQEDAELMQRISQLSVEKQTEILNTANYLKIQSFKNLLIYVLMQKALQDQKQYKISNQELEKEIQREISQKINSLITIDNHRKRLDEDEDKDVKIEM